MRNPFLGLKDSEGIYIYREGRCIIKYKIFNIANKERGKPSVKIISIKHSLSESEMRLRRAKKIFRNFFNYSKWIYIFRPPILISFILGIAILYFGIIEPHQDKVNRLRWIVASVVGVSPQQIQYIGDGWLEISTQRKTAVDRISEPIRYRFNPFRWLFSSEAGFITRWRGKPYGYVTHPVIYNERGEVWIKKESIWQHGVVSNNVIKWDAPQGTGIRAGKVTGHEISIQNKKLHIPDR